MTLSRWQFPNLGKSWEGHFLVSPRKGQEVATASFYKSFVLNQLGSGF